MIRLSVEKINKVVRNVDYLPTDLISGTDPGSRSAYETPL